MKTANHFILAIVVSLFLIGIGFILGAAVEDGSKHPEWCATPAPALAPTPELPDPPPLNRNRLTQI